MGDPTNGPCVEIPQQVLIPPPAPPTAQQLNMPTNVGVANGPEVIKTEDPPHYSEVVTKPPSAENCPMNPNPSEALTALATRIGLTSPRGVNAEKVADQSLRIKLKRKRSTSTRRKGKGRWTVAAKGRKLRSHPAKEDDTESTLSADSPEYIPDSPKYTPHSPQSSPSSPSAASGPANTTPKIPLEWQKKDKLDQVD